MPPPRSDAPSPPGDISNTFIWIAIVLVIVSLMGLSGLAIYNYRRSQMTAHKTLAVGEKQGKATEVFSDKGPPASEAETRDITTALANFSSLLSKHQVPAVGDVFDTNRLLDELDRAGALDSFPNHNSAKTRRDIAQSVELGLAQQQATPVTLARVIKRIHLSDTRTEAVVYDVDTRRNASGAEIRVKMRWWLRKSANGWRVWDFESLDDALRASVAFGAELPGASNPNQKGAVEQCQAVVSATRARDWTKANAALGALDSMQLPIQLVAVRENLRAILHIRQGRYADALKDCDVLAATGQDVPRLFEHRTVGLVHLGQYEPALLQSVAWENVVGGDSELYYERGVAMKHLNRPAESVTMFEKSLDEDPDWSGSLGELSAVLPADDKSEITRRFAKVTKPHLVFTAAVYRMLQDNEPVGVQTIIDAYRIRSESAQDPWLIYYDGELHIRLKQYKEAESLLKSIQAQATVKGQESFAREYFYAAVMAGDAIDAYQSAANRLDAFRQLGSRLWSRADNAMLGKLVGIHLQTFPRDAWGYYYQGRMAQQARDYDGADASYAEAMSLADTADQTTFRREQVYSRYLAGKGLSAYIELKPKDQIFLQLAALFRNHEQGDELAKLVQLRRADAPDDIALPIWDAQVAFLAKDYQAVLTLLANHPATDANRYQSRKEGRSEVG